MGVGLIGSRTIGALVGQASKTPSSANPITQTRRLGGHRRRGVARRVCRVFHILRRVFTSALRCATIRSDQWNVGGTMEGVPWGANRSSADLTIAFGIAFGDARRRHARLRLRALGLVHPWHVHRFWLIGLAKVVLKGGVGLKVEAGFRPAVK